MSIFISFMSLKGKFETVKEQQFPTLASALEAVEKYATENGFSNVKVIHDVDYSVRFTARTPGGRNGRNIAFGDFDFDFTEDEEIAESKPSSAQLSTSVSPSDTRETSPGSLPASPAPSAANGGAGISWPNWKFKVVKKQRGMQGQWFAYPAAMTTESESEAREYAEQFAAEQRAAGVLGTRIVVETRGRKFIAEYKV